MRVCVCACFSVSLLKNGHSRSATCVCCRNLANWAGLDKAHQWAKIWNKSFKTKTCLDFCYTFSIMYVADNVCMHVTDVQAAEEPGGLPEPGDVHEEAAARGPSAQMCGQYMKVLQLKCVIST